jgi:hypothetical protein
MAENIIQNKTHAVQLNEILSYTMSDSHLKYMEVTLVPKFLSVSVTSVLSLRQRAYLTNTVIRINEKHGIIFLIKNYSS